MAETTPPGRAPECPLCVNRDCLGCHRRDPAVSRKWLKIHLPDGGCVGPGCNAATACRP